MSISSSAATSSFDVSQPYQSSTNIHDNDLLSENSKESIENDLWYTENTDGTLSIWSYTGHDSVVALPDNINGRKITNLYSYSFKSDSEKDSFLTEIYLPDTIKNIGTGTFINNILLNRVELGSSVESIGIDAFKNCRSLEEIYIPPTVSAIGENAFDGCHDITIRCTYNSAAHRYAQQYNLPFVLVDGSNIPILYGDVNGDGKITGKDSMNIQRHTINVKLLDKYRQIAADVNIDEKITAKDALEILRYTLKMSNNQNIGTNVN